MEPFLILKGRNITLVFLVLSVYTLIVIADDMEISSVLDHMDVSTVTMTNFSGFAIVLSTVSIANFSGFCIARSPTWFLT